MIKQKGDKKMENILQRDKLVWLMLGVLLMGWMVYKGQVARVKGQEERK